MQKEDFNYDYAPDPLNQSTEGSVGHIVEPPMMPMYSSAPQGSSHGLGLQGDEIVLKFYKSRDTAKKCGKIIMYLGYAMMILDGIGIFGGIVNIIQFMTSPKNGENPQFSAEAAFTPAQMVFG